MPRAVRLLVVLLVLTAVSTAAVETLNWWLTRDADYGLFVRTTWALLRSLAFLVLIWQVRQGRASAPPFALILAVTTLFALGRLVVPKQGMPTVAGVLGFLLVTVLCGLVLLLLYRSEAVRQYLVEHRPRVVLTSKGIERRPMPPRMPPVPGWVLTTRVAALSYSPLVLVAAAVAVGRVFDGHIGLMPVVVAWFGGGLVLSFIVGLTTLFLVRGKGWARSLLVWLTVFVLLIDLPLCWLVLGMDGLIRDGGPLVVAAALALTGLYREPTSATTVRAQP